MDGSHGINRSTSTLSLILTRLQYHIEPSPSPPSVARQVISSMPAEDGARLQLVASTRRPQRQGRHQRLKVTVSRLPAYFTGTGRCSPECVWYQRSSGPSCCDRLRPEVLGRHGVLSLRRPTPGVSFGCEHQTSVSASCRMLIYRSVIASVPTFRSPRSWCDIGWMSPLSLPLSSALLTQLEPSCS